MHETLTPHAEESGHFVDDATFLIRTPSSSAAHIGSWLQGKSRASQPAHMSSSQLSVACKTGFTFTVGTKALLRHFDQGYLANI